MARILFLLSLFLAAVSTSGADPTPRLVIDLGEAAALPAKEFSETGEGVRQVPRAAATLVRIEEGATSPPLHASLRARGGSSLNFPHPTLALRLKDAEAAPLPGLYFCGFYVSPTGMLREISLEAQRLARLIARAPH